MGTAAFFIYGKAKFINKPLDRLPLRERAVFVLYLAGFTQREIKSILGTRSDFVSQAIKMGCKEYECQIGNIFTYKEAPDNENV